MQDDRQEQLRLSALTRFIDGWVSRCEAVTVEPEPNCGVDGPSVACQKQHGYRIDELVEAIRATDHGLVRIGGTLKNGNRAERWLRSTTCFRKIAGNWLIVHDQLSVPLDLESGKALLNLEP
jgi:SnoaL-like domain